MKKNALQNGTDISAEDFIEQERTMEQHLHLIIDACLKLQPGIRSVILYGGFGRGEGSWFKEADSGGWRPYNDYDLRVISHVRIPEAALRSLGKSLAKEIGINWIDLGQSNCAKLSRLKPSIFNYDLKNASKVIYGDATILDEIPEFDSTKIPMKEAQILFFTRLYTLLGSLGSNGFDAGLEGEASRFFRNQMAKAVLAVVDVLLLAKGAYDASYRKRVERVAGLYPGKEELLRISRWALEEKLHPQAVDMRPDEVENLYGLVHAHYFEEMYRGLGMYFGRPVGNPEDIEYCMKWLPKTVLKRLWWLLQFRGGRMERKRAILLAQTYLAAAWKRGSVDEEWLSRGIAHLRAADGRIPRKMSWQEARMEAARMRMES